MTRWYHGFVSPRSLTVGFASMIQGRGPVVVLEGRDPPDIGEVIAIGVRRWRVLSVEIPRTSRRDVWAFLLEPIGDAGVPEEGAVVHVE